MKACIKEKILALNTTEDATDAQKKTFQKECAADAQKDYRESGFDEKDFKLAQKEGARKEATNRMEACVEKNAVLEGVKTCTDEKCKGEKYATAAETCNDDSKKSFVEAGGNAEEFEVEKRKAQKTKIKNTMATCIKSRSVSRETFNTALETCMASELSGKTGGKEKYEARRKCYKSTSVQTELKKLQVSYRSARKVCSNSTKTSYLKVGGKSDKFVREKKKAAVSELKTALKSCVEEKMLEKNVTSLSKELRMEIITDCRSDAEEEFQSAGGKPEQFQEAQKKAAREQLKERGASCIKEYMEDNNIASPTRPQYKAASLSCLEKKKEDYVKSGGDETLYDLEEDKAQTEAMDEKQEAQIENHPDVKALSKDSTDNEKKAAYKSANKAVKDEVKKEFKGNGGDEDDFERKQKETRTEATGSSMRACMEDDLDMLNVEKPTKEQVKAAYNKCKSTATEELQKRGGEKEDFEEQLDGAAKEEAGEALSACMDIDDETAKDQDIENKVDECRLKAKSALENTGGTVTKGGKRRLIDSNGRVLVTISEPDVDTDAAIDEAAQNAVANAMNRCKKWAGEDAKKQQLCKKRSERIYKKYGGDKDKMEKKQSDGAAKLATADRLACKKSGEKSDAQCSQKAKRVFENSGGNVKETATTDAKKTEYTQKVVKRGAVRTAKASFYICMKKTLGTSFTKGDFKTARDTCMPKAKQVFEDAGGDAKLFGALFKKQVRATKTQALSGCRRFAKTATSKAACEAPIKVMAELLGEKPERADRNKQDGRQEEIAEVIESCVRGNGTDCNAKAKREFVEKLGGNEAKFETEKREGLSKESVDALSACMKQEGGFEKEGEDVDECEKSSKKRFKEAGGEEKDFWASKKRNGMKAALDAARDEAEKTGATKEKIREAGKKFYEEELKLDPADFDKEEFDKEIENGDKVVEYKKDREVEMRVSIGSTDRKKDDVNKAKKEMEESIKEAVNDNTVKETGGADETVTVKCGNSSSYGTKTNIVCKIKAKNPETATKLETRTRKPEFGTKLKERYNTKTTKRRRLNEGRHLNTVSGMDIESSQKLTTGKITTDSTGKTKTGGDTGSKTDTKNTGGKKGSSSTAPTPADDDESILSSSAKSSLSWICAIAAISMAYTLF